MLRAFRFPNPAMVAHGKLLSPLRRDALVQPGGGNGQAPEPPKGDATWRVFTSSSAVSANRYPSAHIESGHACKIGNRYLTPFPDSAKETEEFQRKMIRFGSVLRMSGDG